VWKITAHGHGTASRKSSQPILRASTSHPIRMLYRPRHHHGHGKARPDRNFFTVIWNLLYSHHCWGGTQALGTRLIYISIEERPTVRWVNNNCSFHPARDKDKLIVLSRNFGTSPMQQTKRLLTKNQRARVAPKILIQANKRFTNNCYNSLLWTLS
jgi:hypothetical protein